MVTLIDGLAQKPLQSRGITGAQSGWCALQLTIWKGERQGVLVGALQSEREEETRD
jgi:hypothetical protein